MAASAVSSSSSSSEAQRIMNLSLNKIMSSRSRKGGVSLRRNLLVASVLFKARDVYAAEVAGLVVVRNGCVYDRSKVVDIDQKTDPEDTTQPEEELTSGAPNDIDNDQTLTDSVVCDESVTSSGDNGDDDDDDDDDIDSCKENIEPLACPHRGDGPSTKSKRSTRKLAQQRQFCRKRSFTEVENAVNSITNDGDDEEDDVPAKILCTDDLRSNEMSLNCLEGFEPDLPEWCENRVCVSQMETDSLTTKDYESSCDSLYTDISSRMNDQMTFNSGTVGEESLSNYHQSQSTYFSSFNRNSSSSSSTNDDYCISASSNDVIGGFSLSQPLLIVSV